MNTQTFHPKQINVKQLMEWKLQSVKPINGINIPNLTIPPHLVSKKRLTEADDKLVINIRHLFNSLSSENIPIVKQQLHDIIVEKTNTNELIRDVAHEILLNFLVSDLNIKNFMHLLNAVSPICIVTDPSNPNSEKIPNTIGNNFLRECAHTIYESINEKKVRYLAELDQEDPNELDLYSKEREKIGNLIVTICFLYEQRDTPNIKIRAIQIYPIISSMFDTYNKNLAFMEKLGNPEEDSCEDDDEYEILRKMCSIYGEFMCLFMLRSGKDYMIDTTVIARKNNSASNISSGSNTLADLVHYFKSVIVPSFTETYLIAKCREAGF